MTRDKKRWWLIFAASFLVGLTIGLMLLWWFWYGGQGGGIWIPDVGNWLWG